MCKIPEWLKLLLFWPALLGKDNFVQLFSTDRFQYSASFIFYSDGEQPALTAQIPLAPAMTEEISPREELPPTLNLSPEEAVEKITGDSGLVCFLLSSSCSLLSFQTENLIFSAER